MKILKLLLAGLAIFLMSCQQGGNKESSRDTEKNAMLVENAKVEGEDQKGEPGSVEDFVKEASSGGMAEVELGRFAEQNALNPRVKQFGAMMVKDHTKANQELRTVASSKNINVPATMEDTHMKMVNELKKKSGAEFDKEYMKEMVDDHNKDVDEFRKQAENGKDPDIKSFAAKTVEVLLVHQDSAKRIMEALNR